MSELRVLATSNGVNDMATDRLRVLATSNGVNNAMLQNALRRLIGTLDASPSSGVNVWVVPTAGGGSMGDHAEFQSRYGLGRIVEIEPADFAGKPDELRRAVLELDPRIIYIEDGETYTLRHALRLSGGDSLLKELALAGRTF